MKWAERGEREREIAEEDAPRCRVAKRVIAKQGQSARETNDKTAASWKERREKGRELDLGNIK